MQRHNSIHRMPRGLTLLEMLAVVAVFLVLAAIFIMSSNTAMVKARIATVMSEQKTLAHALANYEWDMMEVPPEKQGLQALLGPVQYMNRVPLDPFSAEAQPYRYFSNISRAHRWVVVSIGPDGDSDLETAITEKRDEQTELAGSGQSILLASDKVESFLNQYRYDPTNGTDSNGDVITVYGSGR